MVVRSSKGEIVRENDKTIFSVCLLMGKNSETCSVVWKYVYSASSFIWRWLQKLNQQKFGVYGENKILLRFSVL